MVQIKISASAVFILSAAAIVTVPVAPLLVEQLEQGVLRPRGFKLWPFESKQSKQDVPSLIMELFLDGYGRPSHRIAQ